MVNTKKFKLKGLPEEQQEKIYLEIETSLGENFNGIKQESKVFANYLEDEEELITCVSANHTLSQGMLALTDKKLIFLYQKLTANIFKPEFGVIYINFADIQKIEFNLDVINTLELDFHLLSSECIKFKRIKQGAGRKFIEMTKSVSDK